MDVKTLKYLRKGKSEDIPYKLDSIARGRVQHRNRTHTELMLKQAQQYEAERWVTLMDTEKSKRYLQNRMRVLRHQKQENTKLHRDQLSSSTEKNDDYRNDLINEDGLFLTERSNTISNIFAKAENKDPSPLLPNVGYSPYAGKKTDRGFIKYPKFEVVEKPRFFISPPNLITMGSIRRPKRGDSMQEENGSRTLLRALTDLEIVHSKNQKVELENARLISEMENKMGVKLNTPKRRKTTKKITPRPTSRDQNQSSHNGEVFIGLYPERMKDELGSQVHDDVTLTHVANIAPSMPSHSRLSQSITSSVDMASHDLMEDKPKTVPNGIKEVLGHVNEGKGRNSNLRRTVSKQTLEFPKIPVDKQRKALGRVSRGESVSKMDQIIPNKHPRKTPNLPTSKDEALVSNTENQDTTTKSPKIVSLPRVNIFMEVVDNPFATNMLAKPIVRSRDLIYAKRDEAMHEWLGLEEQQLENIRKVKKTTLTNGEVIEEIVEKDDANKKEANEERLSDLSSSDSEASNAEDDEDERFQVFKEKVIRKSKQKSALETEKETSQMKAEKEHKHFIKNKLRSVFKAVLTVSYFWMIPPGDRDLSKSTTSSTKN